MSKMWKYVSAEVTREFCAAFGGKGEKFTGFTACIVATGELPAGVDPNNKKVQDIIRKCRAANPDVEKTKLKQV